MVLLTVSAIAWKMTSPSTGDDDVCAIFSRVCVRGHDTGDEFGNYPPHSIVHSTAPIREREPPPSYSASMQEYRLRLLLYERLVLVM